MKENKWLKAIKNQKLFFDIVNIVVGILLLIMVVLLFLNPTNRYIIVGAFAVGGLMNVANGIRQLKENKNKSSARTMIMLGVIIMVVGLFASSILS